MQAGSSNFAETTQSSTDTERLQRRNVTASGKETTDGYHARKSDDQRPSIRHAIGQADRAFKAIEMYLQMQQLDKIADLYQHLDKLCIPQSNDATEKDACSATWTALYKGYIDKINNLATKLEQSQEASEWLKRSSGSPNSPKHKWLSYWICYNDRGRGLEMRDLLEFLSKDGSGAARAHFHKIIEELGNWLNGMQESILRVVDTESVKLDEATGK